MTAQLSLVYSPRASAKDAWSRQLESLRSAVNYLGLKEVAFELDVSGSTLCDALNERDRKRWAAEWSHCIKAMLHARHDEIALKLYRAIADDDVSTSDSLFIDERVTLTADQRADEYERELKKTTEGRAALKRINRRAA